MFDIVDLSIYVNLDDSLNYLYFVNTEKEILNSFSTQYINDNWIFILSFLLTILTRCEIKFLSFCFLPSLIIN